MTSVLVVCCNDDCEWTGDSSECVVLKHDSKDNPHNWLCPVCYEVVEII